MDEEQFVTLYIFMEKCDRNLADICLEQILNFVTKIDMCMGAAKGVGFLHRNNIVHPLHRNHNILQNAGNLVPCLVCLNSCKYRFCEIWYIYFLTASLVGITAPNLLLWFNGNLHTFVCI
jgi:serine/threonine protein kinase